MTSTTPGITPRKHRSTLGSRWGLGEPRGRWKMMEDVFVGVVTCFFLLVCLEVSFGSFRTLPFVFGAAKDGHGKGAVAAVILADFVTTPSYQGSPSKLP